MDKKNIFVIDTDDEFKALVKTICHPALTEVKFFSSAVGILSILAAEKPSLILLNLEIPDINDFVMFDLLKKTVSSLSIAVAVTYTQNSELELEKYKRIKYQPTGYYQKPISKEDLENLLKNYVEIAPKNPSPPNIPIDTIPEDIDEFSDDNLDKLVKGEYDENFDNLEINLEIQGDRLMDIPHRDDKDKTKERFEFGLSETLDETKPEFTVDFDETPSTDDSLEIDSIVETGNERETGVEIELEEEQDNFPIIEQMISKPQNERKIDKELEFQVISLESQNEFLRTENKKLSQAIKNLENDLRKLEKNHQQSKSESGEWESRSIRFQNEIAELRKNKELEKNELERKIKTLENQTSKQEDEKSILARSIENLDKEKDDMALRLKEKEKNLARSEQENAKLSQQITGLNTQLRDINSQLTDKERELVAKNHEFEVHLKKKLDEVLQETEDRLTEEFKQKTDHLQINLSNISQKKEQVELELQQKLDELDRLSTKISHEQNELKKREDSWNRTVSTLAEEKVSLSEKINLLSREISSLQHTLKEKEDEYQTEKTQLNTELEKSTNRANFYKTRLEELGQLLNSTLSKTSIKPDELPV